MEDPVTSPGGRSAILSALRTADGPLSTHEASVRAGMSYRRAAYALASLERERAVSGERLGGLTLWRPMILSISLDAARLGP